MIARTIIAAPPTIELPQPGSCRHRNPLSHSNLSLDANRACMCVRACASRQCRYIHTRQESHAYTTESIPLISVLVHYNEQSETTFATATDLSHTGQNHTQGHLQVHGAGHRVFHAPCEQPCRNTCPIVQHGFGKPHTACASTQTHLFVRAADTMSFIAWCCHVFQHIVNTGHRVQHTNNKRQPGHQYSACFNSNNSRTFSCAASSRVVVDLLEYKYAFGSSRHAARLLSSRYRTKLCVR